MAYARTPGGMGSQYGRGNRLAAALSPDHAAISNIKGNTQGLAYALEKGLQGLFAGMDEKDQREGMKMFADVMTKATAPTTYTDDATGTEVPYSTTPAEDIGMDDLPDDTPSATGEDVYGPSITENKPASLGTLLAQSMGSNRHFDRNARAMLPSIYMAEQARKQQLGDRDEQRVHQSKLLGEKRDYQSGVAANLRNQKVSDDKQDRQLKFLLAEMRNNKGTVSYQDYQRAQKDPDFANFLMQKSLASSGLIIPGGFGARQKQPAPTAPPTAQVPSTEGATPVANVAPPQAPVAAPQPQQGQPYIVPGSRADVALQNQQIKNQQLNIQEQQLKLSQQNANKPSSIQQKEYNEGVDAIDSGKVAIQSLNEALELSKIAYEGGTAQERATLINRYWPDALTTDSAIKGAEATKLMDNIIQAQALDALKATFGGMPTEGERKILLQIQGSSEEPQNVRDGIWRRAIRLAQEKIDRTSKKAGLFEKQYGGRYSLGNYGKPTDWGPRVLDTTKGTPNANGFSIKRVK